MTTPLFMLRCVQLGISIADLDSHAFSILSAFKEFEHTSSEKFSFECAGEYFTGFIS